eukprot:Nk52_evm4s352 gene=Nk52_evmTU4s352
MDEGNTGGSRMTSEESSAQVVSVDIKETLRSLAGIRKEDIDLLAPSSSGSSESSFANHSEESGVEQLLNSVDKSESSDELEVERSFQCFARVAKERRGGKEIGNELSDDDVSLTSGYGSGLASGRSSRASVRKGGNTGKRLSLEHAHRVEAQQTSALQKIELQQKDLMINSLKKELRLKVQELEENLQDALHEKQTLQRRIDNLIQTHQEEYRRLHEQTRFELHSVKLRQQQIESQNPLLQDKIEEIKHALESFQCSESDYIAIKSLPEERISLKDFIIMKCYEHTHAVFQENASLRKEIENEKTEVKKNEIAMAKFRRATKISEEEREDKLNDLIAENDLLFKKNDKLKEELSSINCNIETANYKTMNFDSLKAKSDSLEKRVSELETLLASSNKELELRKGGNDKCMLEIDTLKQSVNMLNRDKSYLEKEIDSLSEKNVNLKEELHKSEDALSDVKSAKEQMYEKYVLERDQEKQKYEQELKTEIEKLHQKTHQDLEQIRINQKDCFERELRCIRESRDLACADRDRSLIDFQELARKYENVTAEYRVYQRKADGEIADLQNSVKMKNFELERMQMLRDECSEALAKSENELGTYRKKTELLTKEFYELQNATSKRIRELEFDLDEASDQVKNFAAVEDNLDHLLLDAAETCGLNPRDDLLKTCGVDNFNNNLVSNKRRMKQSVLLAKKVIELQKENRKLEKNVLMETEAAQAKDIEIESLKRLLSECKQPHNFLVDQIRSKDAQICELLKKIDTLSGKLELTNRSNEKLQSLNSSLHLDMQVLLAQKQEIINLKAKVKTATVGSQMKKLPPCNDNIGFASYSQCVSDEDLDKENEPQNEKPQWFKKIKNCV